MADFSTALPYVLANEGGYANVPGDKGGETMYGITVATARKYGYTGAMKDLPVSLAGSIYRDWYWDPLYLDSVASQAVATKLLDMSANFGPGGAAKIGQEAVNTIIDPPVDVDGAFGSDTLDAINSADEKDYLTALANACADHYQAIVDSNPSQSKFLNGWMARAAKVPGIIAGGIGAGVILMIGLGIWLFMKRGNA
jgi:lysozyme family protein